MTVLSMASDVLGSSGLRALTYAERLLSDATSSAKVAYRISAWHNSGSDSIVKLSSLMYLSNSSVRKQFQAISENLKAPTNTNAPND